MGSLSKPHLALSPPPVFCHKIKKLPAALTPASAITAVPSVVQRVSHHSTSVACLLLCGGKSSAFRLQKTHFTPLRLPHLTPLPLPHLHARVSLARQQLPPRDVLYLNPMPDYKCSPSLLLVLPQTPQATPANPITLSHQSDHRLPEVAGTGCSGPRGHVEGVPNNHYTQFYRSISHINMGTVMDKAW